MQSLHENQFTLDLDQLNRIFDYCYIRSNNYSFPVTDVEFEYMFDTLGFRGLHHGSPPFIMYLLEKVNDGLSEE